jgi:Spy/CpxP family protein refolding chaperone
MSKAKFILAATFVMALAAGAAVGVVGTRTVAQPGAPKDRRPSLVEELQLSPEQAKKMEEIWSGVMRRGRGEQFEKFRAIQKERDEAILSLFTSEQKTEYDKLMAEYGKRFEELNQERERAFQQAVEQTRQILTEPQRQKYEELMKKRREERGSDHRDRGSEGSSPFGGGGGPGSRHRPSSQPAQ